MADQPESSTAAGRRAKRPRLEPRRVIEYSADEARPEFDAIPVPIAERHLEEHTLLQFATGTSERQMRQKIIDLELLQARTFDWKLIGQLGQLERIQEMVTDRWRRVLECRLPQFYELTVEFHSTFTFVSGSLASRRAVSFALGRQVRQMSIREFAVAAGLYTAEETRQPIFTESLRGIAREPTASMVTETELSQFWRTIADGAWSSSLVESSIRDPIHRYIHRIISCTIIGRRSGAEKCTHLDVFCLYCIIGRREANLATIMLSSFDRRRRGGRTARLDMGPYITRLARHFGVFDHYPERLLTQGPETITYEQQDMRLAGMCPLDDPPRWEIAREYVQAPPPPNAPAEEAPQIGQRPPRRRIVQRLERPLGRRPAREPRPERVTLEAIWEAIGALTDTVTEEIGALRDMTERRLDAQDRAIRFLIEDQGREVPEWFRADREEQEAEDDDQEDD